MWEAIRSNQRRSMVLISIMGAILVLLGFVIGMTADPEVGGPFGAVGALGLWLVMLLVAYAQGDSILLMSSRAKKIEKKDAPMLWNIVEEMTIASGLGKMPSVYIMDDDSPNAFAVGRKPEKASVAVTTGLLKRLNRDELQGVIAHEIGHIQNQDVKFMTLAAVMVGCIALLADLFLRSMFYSSIHRRRSRKSNDGQAIFMVIAIVVAILAPIVVRLLYLACSRKREYLADASGALYTRYPEGLASALEKISQRAVQKKKQVNRALAPMYIINPLQPVSLMGLFSTHPPTSKRVSILRSMSGAGFASYEEAYRNVHGKSESCIGTHSLSEADAVAKRKASVSKKENKKQEVINRLQNVNDLAMLFGPNLFVFNCTCGVRIKVPKDLKRDSVPCPSCGAIHAIPGD